MARLQPLERTVLAALQQGPLAAQGDLVLVACSGGPDSLVLLHVLARLRRLVGCSLAAAYVDHGLRPAAAREGRRVVASAVALGVPARVLALGLRAGGNLMARARQARYAALEAERARVGAASIALAHTATDQAETLLMRLLDGSGSAGLAAMAPRRGHLVRPMLEVTRAEVEAFVKANGLRPVRDPSNRDPAFRRVRLRALLGALRKLQPDADRALARSAANLRDDAEVLAWASAELGAGRVPLDLDLGRLSGLPAPVRGRALRDAVASTAGRALSRREALALAHLADRTEGTEELDVAGIRVRRSYRRLSAASRAVAPPAAVAATGSGAVGFGPHTLHLELSGPVLIRSPRPGDRIALPGGGHKKVSRVLADAKVPRADRAGFPVICDPSGERALVVPGLSAPVGPVSRARLGSALSGAAGHERIRGG